MVHLVRQDLSVAGRRAGLDGERSGLFMEQIRIIKEMRNECIRQLQLSRAAYDIRCISPRYMVWENVCGALSSGTPRGEDFRIVLEETARIADKDAVIPRLEKGSKWTPSGCIMGDGWSIAWRVHDAQFWGVPQRRRRIALVADFAGESAPEILFERKSVSGDSEKSGESGERTSETTAGDVNSPITIAFDRAAFNQGKNALYDFAVEEEKAQPGVARGGGGTDQTVGALCAADAKHIGNQYVEQGKCVIQSIPKNGTPAG